MNKTQKEISDFNKRMRILYRQAILIANLKYKEGHVFESNRWLAAARKIESAGRVSEV